MGERSGWWAGFGAECLVWRGVGSWVDGWLKGWESRVIGFGWSEPQLERAMLLLASDSFDQALAVLYSGPNGERFFKNLEAALGVRDSNFHSSVVGWLRS